MVLWTGLLQQNESKQMEPKWPAVGFWEAALAWKRAYTPREGDVFTCGVIYPFLCALWNRLRVFDRSLEFYEKAQKTLEGNKRQYLIPGMGTYVFRNALSQANCSMR